MSVVFPSSSKLEAIRWGKRQAAGPREEMEDEVVLRLESSSTTSLWPDAGTAIKLGRRTMAAKGSIGPPLSSPSLPSSVANPASAAGEGLVLGGGWDPADDVGIGGLRWQSWRGVVFGRQAFEGEGHAAAVLRWKVGDSGGGVSSLVGRGEDVFPLFGSFDLGEEDFLSFLREPTRLNVNRPIRCTFSGSSKHLTSFSKVTCFFNQRSQFF
jgi:hypothetical protein